MFAMSFPVQFVCDSLCMLGVIKLENIHKQGLFWLLVILATLFETVQAICFLLFFVICYYLASKDCFRTLKSCIIQFNQIIQIKLSILKCCDYFYWMMI